MRRQIRRVRGSCSDGRRQSIAFAVAYLLAAACILDDVPDDRLGGLAPPCLSGWVESDDGTVCILLERADTGSLVDSGPTADSGPTVDAGPDGGTDAPDSAIVDAGAGCFDPQLGTPPTGPVPTQPVINEWAFVHLASNGFSGNYYEFVEIFGPPETDFSDLSFLVINSHSGRNLGVVEHVIPIETTNRGGFWRSCDGWMDNTDALIQNSSSLFLVRAFSGVVGADLDPDDNGVLDSTPWDEVIDQVSYEDGDAVTDIFYATPVLTNDGYLPEHSIRGSRALASRIIDGQDTGSETDWRKGAFTGYGLPNVMGTPQSSEAWITPGMPNRIEP